MEILRDPPETLLFWGNKDEVEQPQRIREYLLTLISVCEKFSSKPDKNDGKERFENFLMEK